MTSRKEWNRRIRSAALALFLGISGLINPAVAGERKFLVTLAFSRKQYPQFDNGQPPTGLVNREFVRRQYFEENPNDLIGSFAEYWEEISYGDVTVSGRVTDWILLPWAIQPPLRDVTRAIEMTTAPGENVDAAATRVSPANFFDIDDNSIFQYGIGERFNNANATTANDYDGNPGGNENGPFGPDPGSMHATANAGHPVYKPGERFVDIDNDNRWDGLDEANNWMDHNGDGRPDNLGRWLDFNGDDEAQAPMGCVYLPDDDNDGFPNCCPNGPGTMPCDCPALMITFPDNESPDCNGNLVPDDEDIATGTSMDRLPYMVSGTMCIPGAGDGIPDECQFMNYTTQCRSPAENCMGGDPGPCCTGLHPPCVPLAVITLPQRCEFHDANADMRMDIVEPFENFMRKWDPCLFDPDVSPQNVLTTRAHWVKVYDPNSLSAGSPLACMDPMYTHDYGDPSYITNNYPGDADSLVHEADARMIYGQHDPMNLLPPGQCVCRDGTPCANYQLPDGSIITRACVAGLHAVYNPPDSWTNQEQGMGMGGTGGVPEVTSAKFQAQPGSGGRARFAIATPEPGTYPSPQGAQDTSWYQQAWMDRYGVPMNQVPPWPMGFDPMGMPIPGGPPAGSPMANTLRMVPFIDTNSNGYDPEMHRRFFKANFGGLSGRGIGWISICGDNSTVVRFETGPLAALGFEEACNRRIMPEERGGMSMPAEFYDGYVEHDDLPSSKYHGGGDLYLGEVTSPFRTYYTRSGAPIGGQDAINPGYAGSDEDPQSLIPAIWGDDLGDNNPNTPSLQGDQILLAAGPYATRLYGSQGRDAGNLLLLELLTWRTAPPFNNGFVWEDWNRTYHHPFAGPGTTNQPNENLGFRDYNLDGLVDIGETRPGGSENYQSDSDIGTGNNGTNTVYPFNRQRMLEDCVMILDEGLDFDDFVDDVTLNAITCGGGVRSSRLPVQFLTPDMNGDLGIDDFVQTEGICSGIVLLAPFSHKPNDFPIAPSFYPIHNEDAVGDPEYVDSVFPRAPDTPQIAWNIHFHDLVIALDQAGEGGGQSEGLPNSNFQTPYSAHEYLHSWEGFPDLYDYDVFSPAGPLINCPIGDWDIMAGSSGGLVHPTPILKAKECTEWIDPVDLTTVLTPGVETTLTLPPAEFVRDNSYFFFPNENRLGENYWFWSAGSGFDDPDPFPIEYGFPGDGVLIMHSDVGANPDATPLQQTSPPFTYLIVGSDGFGELEAGTDCGDPGDPWPGIFEAKTFDCNTNPPSRWYNENSCTGISISNIVLDGQGSAQVTFNWVPTSIPGIKFIDPPGGESIQISPTVSIYEVRTEATDVFGGTWIRLFRSSAEGDRTIDPNGSNFIGFVRKQSPGTNMEVIDWNINGTADGRYYMFADLIPGEGSDGEELSFTTPRPGRNNNGTGSMTVNEVDVNRLVASGFIGQFVTNTTFAAVTETGVEVNFTGLGVQVGDQLATGAPTRANNGATTRKPVLRQVTNILNGGRTLVLSSPIAPPPGTGAIVVTSWIVTNSSRDARSESWVVECTNPAGTDWRVFSSLTQPQPSPEAPNQDPYLHAMTGQQYTSQNGAVKFTIHSGTCSGGANNGDPCTTAGHCPAGTCVVGTPFTIGDRFVFVTTGISATSQGVTILNGAISEGPVAVIEATPLAGDPPLLVQFDGRESFDPEGRPLTYQWDFGDGSFGNGGLLSHVYAEGGDYTVVLRVTNPLGLFGESGVDINVTNNSPNAVIVAAPISGPPRMVTFNGGLSTDLETPTSQLTYEWTFGDGATAGPGDPGEFVSTSRFYGTNGTYVASLRVTDEGGKQDTATVTILVGNTLPIPNISHSGLVGQDPHEVRFNGINSTDPDGEPVTIRWDWDATDTVVPTSGPCSAQPAGIECYPASGPSGSTTGIVPHTFRLSAGQTSATFQVRALVCDNHQPTPGCVTWPGVTVTVSPAGVGASDPRAIFTITPNPPLLNQQFATDARLSFDRPAGSLIASYTWNWGDGTTGAGVTATHTYTRPGTFVISLTVADGETPPNTNTTSQTVIVTGETEEPPDETENRPPTAVISINPSQGVAGETEFQLSASASADPDGDDLTYSWTFGDGTTATGEEVTHVFATAGDFQVRLTVRDEANASATALQTLEVLPVGSNRPPVARIATGLRTGSEGVTLTFDARSSYDPDGEFITYDWKFYREGEDEAFDSDDRSIVNYRFDARGTYRVELTVRDPNGVTASANPEVVQVVARVAPPDGGDVPIVDPGRPVVPPSANQRPGAICGLGMVLSLFGSLAGLCATAVARKRYRGRKVASTDWM